MGKGADVAGNNGWERGVKVREEVGRLSEGGEQ